MATQFKSKKMWEQEAQETSAFNDSTSSSFQKELIGYTFLKNLWGTHLFDKQELTSQDKIDSINKIVGMMKAQIKLMVLAQNKQIDDMKALSLDTLKSPIEQDSLQVQLNQMKRKVEMSKAKEEQLNCIIEKQNRNVSSLQQENQRLRNQIQELKQAKNKANQQLIYLSNRCYELERVRQAPYSASFDQFSAISIQREEENDERPRVSLFGRKDSKILQSFCQDNASLCSQQETLQRKESFNELNLKIGLKNSNSMKQSLQFNYTQDVNSENYGNFMQEMKLIKLKTERIIGAESDKFLQRQQYRKTLQPRTNRPQAKDLGTTVDFLKQKRFRRIR